MISNSSSAEDSPDSIYCDSAATLDQTGGAGEPDDGTWACFKSWANKNWRSTAGTSVGLVLLSMTHWIVCGAVLCVVGFPALAFLIFACSAQKGQKIRWALSWLYLLALWMIVATIGKPPPLGLLE
jgi:hypothetical protein